MLKTLFWFLTKRKESVYVYYVGGKAISDDFDGVYFCHPKHLEELTAAGVNNVKADKYCPLHFETVWFWE